MIFVDMLLFNGKRQSFQQMMLGKSEGSQKRVNDPYLTMYIKQIQMDQRVINIRAKATKLFRTKYVSVKGTMIQQQLCDYDTKGTDNKKENRQMDFVEILKCCAY